MRRKDASGVVNKKEEEAKEGEKEKTEEKKSSADTGKIVNLMAGTSAPATPCGADTSGDTNRIGNSISGAYYIYGAPFEIIVASVFLYKSVNQMSRRGGR